MGAPLKKFCACCNRPFTEEEYAEKLRRKMQNAANSRAKAAANGNRIGRKYVLDPAKVYALWLAGKRVSFIAGQFNVCAATVYRALERAKGNQ